MSKTRTELVMELNRDIRVFHCGSQYMDWTERNCDRCVLGSSQDDDPKLDEMRCDMELMLVVACLDDGLIDRKTADGIGYTGGPPFSYTWDCPERATPKDN